MKGEFHEVTYGYCECGCGQKTKIATQTKTDRGQVRGEHLRFINGHNCYARTGENNPGWKGGRQIIRTSRTTYFKVLAPRHPRRDRDGYVYEHIVVVEKAMGKKLSRSAVVHHIDFDGLNNKLENLMIFPNTGAHTSYHAKQRRMDNG